METLFALGFSALGAVLGSFAGVIAERMHTGQTWLSGRSRCTACARTLTAPDLIPIVSWLRAFGRCSVCHARYPSTYLALECLTAALFLAAYAHLGITYALVPLLLFLFLLVITVLYDLRHLIVPHALSTLLICTALAYAAYTAPDMHAFGITLAESGGIALILFLFYALSGGRVMGLGDAPVALALSLVAARAAIAGLVFSFWIGAVIGIALLLLGRGRTKMNSEVPFVPFLAAGFLLALFTGWSPLPF